MRKLIPLRGWQYLACVGLAVAIGILILAAMFGEVLLIAELGRLLP